MARFKMRAPDGVEYEFTAPDGTSDDDAAAYFKKQWLSQQGSKSDQQEVGTVEGTLRRTADAFTFGFADKASSLVRSAYNGYTYDQNLAHQQARTKASGEQFIPWIVGDTAGMTAQAALTMPAQGARGTYSVLREAMRPVTAPLGAVLDDGVRVVSQVPAAALRQGLAAKEAAQEAVAPVTNALAAFTSQVPNMLRYGATAGAADAAGHTSGTATNQLMDVGYGTAAGAILAPVVGAGMFGAGKLVDVARRRRETRADAVAANVAEAREIGITQPFGPAFTDTGPHARVAQITGAGIGGASVGKAAGANIDDWQRGMSRVLSEPVGGREAGDLGQSVQQDLRRALVQRSAGDIAERSSKDLEAIAGPVGESGFGAPRPNVQPIRPREVDPVQPRDVGPEPVRPDDRGRVDFLRDYSQERQRAIDAAVAEHNRMAEASAAVKQRYSGVIKQHEELAKQEQAIRSQFDSITPRSWRNAASPEDVAAVDAELAKRAFGPVEAAFMVQERIAKRHAAIVKQMDDIGPDVAIANDAIAKAEGGSAERLQAIRELHRRRDAVERRFVEAQAKTEAEKIQYERASADFSASRAKALADAEEATAQARAQAQREAAEATRLAQQSADDAYQRELAGGRDNFQPGRSRESYPTEFDAAYELVHRATPKATVNPLGDPFTKTATSKLLSSVADDAKRTLKLNDYSGDVFGGPNSSLDPALFSYLRSRIGDDLAGRLATMADRRAGNQGMSYEATRALYSDLGKAARAAEKPPYPGVPRNEDAALMRRLQGALRQDLYEGIRAQGQPTRFSTDTDVYDVGRTGQTTSQSVGRPSDATYYVQPNHLERLMRDVPQSDKMASWPATVGLKVDKSKTQGERIGKFDNVRGEFDRATLVPIGKRPEKGMVPVQVWDEGQRVQTGSPIVSRSPTEGERAVAMFQNVDRGYEEYINTLRRPLAKIFGEDVQPVQAMERLAKAAKSGETSVVGAYSRVMYEKADPNKGAAALIHYMTGGGRNMKTFLTTWEEIPDATKRVLFRGPQGQQLQAEINRYVRVGERLERYVKAADTNPIVDPRRISHMLTVSAAFANVPAVVSMIAGNAAVARMMSSPRYLRWLSEVPDKARGGFDTAAFRNHMSRLSAMGAHSDGDKELVNGIVQAFAPQKGK